MADETKPAEQRKATSPQEAMMAMGLVFGDSVKQLVMTAEAQQTAILAITAMLAVAPGIAEVDPRRVAVIIESLTMGRKEGERERVREQVANYVAMIVGIAGKLPQIIADAEKAEAAAGKGGNSKSSKKKPN
ncbi:MAG TPA: hypothetical protein VFB45_24895 [Pseudolabrys sp.]|nr:hypothetical protein [Pseudolabrys sp.]